MPKSVDDLIAEQLRWAEEDPDPWMDCDCRGSTGCDKCEKIVESDNCGDSRENHDRSARSTTDRIAAE